MAVRLIVDGSFNDSIQYYETFPIEPVVGPSGFMDVRLPIDPADRLSPITLQTLLRRMSNVPTQEKQLLIVCHGNEQGLAIPLAAGSNQRADRFNLHILLMLAIARLRISKKPSAAEWERILRDMTLLDGTPMFPPMPKESTDRHQQIFDWFFARLGGNTRAKFPSANEVQILTPPKATDGVAPTFTVSFKNATSKPALPPSAKASQVQTALENMSTIHPNNIVVTGNDGGPWTCTFVNALGGKPQPIMSMNGGGSVTRVPQLDENSFVKIDKLTNNPRDLDELVTLRNKLFGRFDRLDFRACNIAKSDGKLGTLHKMVAFFGVRKVCAPDVVSFNIDMTVVIDRAFDKDFDNKVEAATNKSLSVRGPRAGRQPVRLDQGDPNPTHLVPIARGDIPRSRSFDTDKSRPGDELFIRLWVTQILPHRFTGWLRAIATANVEQFVKDKIDPDTSRWTIRTRVPMSGLWLVDDFNVPFLATQPLKAGPSSGDPLEGLGLGSPPPSSLPSFALPRDPEYVKHLFVGV
jgi:hypothetical protein